MSSVPVGNIFQIFIFVKQSNTWVRAEQEADVDPKGCADMQMLYAG
jgi:hypothetical protein